MQVLDETRLRIFVSYSRNDTEWVSQLCLILERNGFEAIRDVEDIDPGERWKPRIADLILSSDRVVIVLTEKFCDSTVGRWEAEQALRHRKDPIPVVPAPIDEALVPANLANCHRVLFYNDPKHSGSGFGRGQILLLDELAVAGAWRRKQTRILERTHEWLRSQRSAHLLLPAHDIVNWVRWHEATPKSVEIPAEIAEYLEVSITNANEVVQLERAKADRQRRADKKIGHLVRERAELERRLRDRDVPTPQENDAPLAPAVPRSRRDHTPWVLAIVVMIVTTVGGAYLLFPELFAIARTILSAPQLGATTVVSRAGDVNVRAAPNVQSERIETLRAGEELEVIATVVQGTHTWYEVRVARNRTGFVRSDVVLARHPG